MRTIQQLVSAEVHYCVSGLVAALAKGCPGISPENSQLVDLCERAIELSMPLPDYESAAIEAGWREEEREPEGQHVFRDDTDGQTWCAKDWQALCEAHDIEPHDREIYEHWLISDWLADKLEAKGEKVDRDFAGMTIWARTTTGQSIELDSVIEETHADLVREYGR